jgi:hypothetical protein
MANGAYLTGSLYLEISVRDQSGAEISQITAPSKANGLTIEITNGATFAQDVTVKTAIVRTGSNRLAFIGANSSSQWDEQFTRVVGAAGSRRSLDAKAGPVAVDERLQCLGADYKDSILPSTAMQTWAPTAPLEVRIKLT